MTMHTKGKQAQGHTPRIIREGMEMEREWKCSCEPLDGSRESCYRYGIKRCSLHVAAPELLKALWELAEDLHESRRYSSSEPNPCFGEFIGCKQYQCSKILALLAKAEGRADG